ncbi:YIP1 family protein [Albibacillus kandeliae]|uniref:YIP1 family protein n=1 Tax=Albibacillus kandeliae TaxID=2174228 RepID=UPI000D68EBEE|nr:YIP1 family protein [Albibacillus kandeliae]
MAVTSDITATYRGPGRVVERLLAAGQRDDRALAFLMAFCLLMFIAQMPRLARQAYLTGEELNPLLGGALLGWIVIAPLCFYLIAAVSHVLIKAVGGKGSFYGARLALFWALLASTPVLLLHGLTAGFVGPGAALQAVGLLWIALFFWFWIAGLLRAEGFSK